MTPNKLRVSQHLMAISSQPPTGRAILAGAEIVCVVWPTGYDRGLSEEQAAAERDEHARALVDAFNDIYRP